MEEVQVFSRIGAVLEKEVMEVHLRMLLKSMRGLSEIEMQEDGKRFRHPERQEAPDGTEFSHQW